ncbi:MAG: hybrid sensor histidine kinase/response regulator [Flavobacterium sp.]
MTLYLDSLSSITKKQHYFVPLLKSKQKTEYQITLLRKQLDSLLNLNSIPTDNKAANLNLKKYDYNSVLNSITYDTTRTLAVSKKKGLLKRIGSAIKGTSDTDKEEVKTVITMVFKNKETKGSFEDQLRNIFLFTDKYYGNQAFKLKKAYLNLQKKDNFLLKINQEILMKSQDILLAYTESNQELTKLKYSNDINAYNLYVENQKKDSLYLLFFMISITLLLLCYTIYAYSYEDNLEKTKKEVENNLEFKNRIIGMLSHEMRAPLNIISNLTNKLKKENANKTLSSAINSLHFTSNSLQITVNQILDFFKHESTKLTLYNSKVNLKKEVKTITASLKSLTDIKNIDLITDIDESLNQKIWIDNGKMHQLFYNIIGNAIKFTNNGNITVSTKLTPVENKFRFDVKIKDTGVGIPKEDLDKIFDKYYQSKNYKEQISFGAGLGLNLCREIVELYDGKISVSSELNKGTEISFYLLLEKAIDSEKNNQTRLIEKIKDQKIKIAVVDDDAIILTVIKKLATDVGFIVTTFNTSDNLINHLKTETVAIIISDLQIGNTSGIELIKEIKELDNNNKSAKIIAITGDINWNKTNIKTIQADEILIKPINKEEFYHKLLQLVSTN